MMNLFLLHDVLRIIYSISGIWCSGNCQDALCSFQSELASSHERATGNEFIVTKHIIFILH